MKINKYQFADASWRPGADGHSTTTVGRSTVGSIGGEEEEEESGLYGEYDPLRREEQGIRYGRRGNYRELFFLNRT